MKSIAAGPLSSELLKENSARAPGARTEISFTELVSGSGKKPPCKPDKKGPLSERCSHWTSGIVFGARAGISGKSSGALTEQKKLLLNDWSAANGGLRDGGLSKSEGYVEEKGLSSSIFWISHPPEKGEKTDKGRKRPISADFQEGQPDTS